MFKIKKNVYKRSKMDIVVASKFMYERVSQSSMFENFRIHHIPFGLDLNIFKPGDQQYSKSILGIDPDEIVIAFRSAPGDFKGLEHIKTALKNVKSNKKICILTFNKKWQVEEFRSQYKVIDLGWVYDDELLTHAYNAADFFLMPSMQESFGMMAMEAMAFGKPVIVFSGTALPDVVGGPDRGIIVPSGDCRQLSEVIEKLLHDMNFRLDRGAKVLDFAQRNYSIELHMKKLIDVYDGAIKNFKMMT
jgi:glycosyltransferase involved in cell wall biosynthesis